MELVLESSRKAGRKKTSVSSWRICKALLGSEQDEAFRQRHTNRQGYRVREDGPWRGWGGGLEQHTH